MRSIMRIVLAFLLCYALVVQGAAASVARGRIATPDGDLCLGSRALSDAAAPTQRAPQHVDCDSCAICASFASGLAGARAAVETAPASIGCRVQFGRQHQIFDGRKPGAVRARGPPGPWEEAKRFPISRS